MPDTLTTPISNDDLAQFEVKLANKEIPLTDRFLALSKLYKRFSVNLEDLQNFENQAVSLRLKNDYELKKNHWDNELLELKNQFKQLDNRIVAAEQKMSRGIPDDLLIMEKLIAEQESIVFDQEKLNKAESEVINHVREIDIEYGRQQEKLNQKSTTNQQSSITINIQEKLEEIIATEKSIQLKAKFAAILPILAIPIIVDFLTINFGLLNKSQGHSILSGHFIFLIAFILTEIFLGDKIRNFTSNIFATNYLKATFNQLKSYADECFSTIKKIENANLIKKK